MAGKSVLGGAVGSTGSSPTGSSPTGSRECAAGTVTSGLEMRGGRTTVGGVDGGDGCVSGDGYSAGICGDCSGADFVGGGGEVAVEGMVAAGSLVEAQYCKLVRGGPCGRLGRGVSGGSGADRNGADCGRDGAGGGSGDRSVDGDNSLEGNDRGVTRRIIGPQTRFPKQSQT